MALTVTQNLVEGASFSRVYDGITLIERGTIICLVTGFTANNIAPNAALTAAAAAVQAKLPYGTRPPGAIRAVVTGWFPLGFRESDDAARVAVSLDTITLPSSPGTIIISDSESTENDTTQFFRDDTKGIIQQLTVGFKAPKIVLPAQNLGGGAVPQTPFAIIQSQAAITAAPPIIKSYTGTISYEKTVRRVVLQTSVLAQNLAPYRQAINCTNDKPWNGLPAFFWKLSGFSTTTRDLGNSYQVQLESSADIQKDVSKYIACKDTSTGKWIQVNPTILSRVQNLPYTYGIIYGLFNPGPPPVGATDGIMRVGQYRPVSFSALFGNFVP